MNMFLELGKQSFTTILLSAVEYLFSIVGHLFEFLTLSFLLFFHILVIFTII